MLDYIKISIELSHYCINIKIDFEDGFWNKNWNRKKL